ncbi:MAG: DEAD/DEAH box helicase [Tissierellia bacterium]|nr:DEAD/DEAH box helicase [Tissierellia bacterium]
MKKLRFDEVNLSEEIQKAVKDMGFEEMSPIQSQAIPPMLEGLDIIGQAQTGTGKTAAFGIPIIEKYEGGGKAPEAIILCPTRELSIQVAEEIRTLAKYRKDIFVLPIYGGQPIGRQINALKRGVQIVVGTPGRIIDHIRRGTLKLGDIKTVVLDEADEMFDMGFRDDIELILNPMPKDRQTVFFSATMPSEIVNFAKRYQNNPKIIKVVHKELTVPRVEQYYFELKGHMKTEILSRLIDIYNPKLSIVFCNTKKKVDELTIELQGRGYFADGLHGDLRQTQRDKVMSKFRSGKIDILVATDVAARGLDVDDVDIVFNYDIPHDEEYYVHRIGRTARAGREGMAFSLAEGRDVRRIKDIQRYTKTKIARKDLPTLQEIEERQTGILLEKIKEEVDKGGLGKYEEMLNLLLEEDYSSFDVATVLLKFYLTKNKLGSHTELNAVDYGNKGITAMTRLYINVGKRKGVSPRHIVGAILNETSLPRKSVGKIDMYDKFAFVEVPEEYAEEAVKELNNKRIKGIVVRVELANPKNR